MTAAFNIKPSRAMASAVIRETVHPTMGAIVPPVIFIP